jgi:hypothetical protein
MDDDSPPGAAIPGKPAFDKTALPWGDTPHLILIGNPSQAVREGRIGLDRFGERLDLQTLVDGQRQLTNHLASVATNNRTATKAPGAWLDPDGDIAFLVAIDDSPVVIVEWCRQPEQFNSGSLTIRAVPSDVGNFRIGVGDPWNDQSTHSRAPIKERIANDDPGHRIGGMGKLLG